MKFPRVLSKERLSLLSPEDRKIYEYEHSDLYVQNDNIDENINTDILKFNDLNEDYNISESLFNEQFDAVYYDKELIKEIGLDDYNLMKKNIYEFIQNNNELIALNEEGIAIDYWAKGLKLGWLGKLTAGLLTGLVGIIAWLLMKGKDRLAMVQLKKYMNKIVELVDSGVNKKRPWYSFLIPSKSGQRNTGDYNKACFRTIQETAERNMACLYSQCIFSLGFLNPSRSDFNGITSGFVPEKGSGLDTFNNLVNSLTGQVNPGYINDTEIPLKPNAEVFQNLKLPALPTNYAMLMSNIDYPTKAKQNPNGSLFMKPTEEILKAKGQDIGSAYFNKNINMEGVVNVKQSTNEDYFIPYEYIQKALFEVESELTGMDKLSGVSGGGLLTGDLTGGVLGANLAQEIKGKEETNVNEFKGNILDAIDNYIRASVPIIAKLIRSISGKDGGDKASTEYLQLIMQMNSAAENNMNAFLEKNFEDLMAISKQNRSNYDSKVKDQIENSRTISALLAKLQDDKDKTITDKAGFRNKLIDAQFRGLNKTQIKRIFGTFAGKKTSIEKFLGIGESLFIKNYVNALLESDLGDDDSEESDEKKIKTDKEKLEETLTQKIVSIYGNMKDMLSVKITGIIHNNPEDWYIIKNSRERMKALKEAADKEITAKIDLICRTANSGKSDIGDKFKAALSTHPVRAEGLKGLWAKYSDDLQDRIESRIRSITGDNGNSNILDTIKEFLTVTYPNLIGIMIYYKSLFYLLKIYTKENPISTYTQEDFQIRTTNDDFAILSTILEFKGNNND